MKSILQNKLSHKMCAVLFVIGLLASSPSKGCNAFFNSVPDSVGTGITFTSTSTGTTGTTHYNWSFGDGGVGYSSTEYHQYATAGWYLVCLTIYDTLNGCQSTICDSLYAGSNGFTCQAMFTTQANGLAVTFLNQSTGVNLNYHWDFGDGSSSNGQNATHTYAVAGQYLACLTISSGTCSDTMCNYVTVTGGGGGNCQASFNAIDSAGITYFYGMANGTQGNVSYSWDFGDGTFGSNQFETHVYNGIGYLACLTITDVDSNQTVLCTSTFCDSILPGGNSSSCQASFSWVTGFNTGQIDFTDQSTASDSIIGWQWDFGDGNVGTGSNPSHTYVQTGTYYVCLNIIAINQNGAITCTSSICNWVQVQVGGGGCQASFNAIDSAGIYVFINTSSGLNGNTTYYWNFGDGFTAYGLNATHTYNAMGGYLVCLTISDSAAGCFDTQCDSIWVNGGGGNQCQAAFNAIPDSAGNGYSFYNTSTGTNISTSYAWTVSDGTSATGNFFQHTFSTQGWFAVCLTITVFDSLQNITCSSTTCDSVYVGNGGGASCNAYWGYQGSLFTTFFADLSTGTDSIVSWTWNFGDNSTSTLQNPVHTYAQSGYYYVCLTIETGSQGAVTCTDTYCQTIYAGNNSNGCQANFSMYPDSSGMGFQFQNISTGTTGTTIYTWSFGDGNSATSENPFHTYATAGWYTVCLTISDSANNCSSTYCDTLNVGPSFSCNPYFVWNGDTTNGVQFYQFNGNLPGIVYLWNFGDGDSSSSADPYHQYAPAGTYYACLTVLQLDSNGVVYCTGSYCDSIYTGANSQACVQIGATPDSNAWGNGNMNFSVSSSCGTITSVSWDFGDGSTGTGMSLSHQYSATGWYVVCVDIEINGVIYTQCDSVFALRLMGIEEANGELSAIDIYPNPASAMLNLSYALKDAQQISIMIYDVTGRMLQSVLDQKQSAGLHQVPVNVQGLNTGMYVVKISTDKSAIAKRIVVNR